ncbi:MAG: SpoIIIAH-like family protein [Dysosmobacter sp.]|nr:SpoIIIAH-like family protein [Dysosmobacter sp.]
MRRNWRRNGVVAAMLVLVGAAVFLNWKYTGEAGEAAAQEAGTKILGQSTLVSGTGDAAAGSGGGDLAADGADGEAVYTGSDYFASARLTRQQARDNAIDLLEKAAGEEGADKAVANEASQGIQVLASYTLTEAQIENLVTAKGYKDCVAFMNDDSVSVVVATDSGELTGEDVAKITDITKSETGYPAGSIKIMAAN